MTKKIILGKTRGNSENYGQIKNYRPAVPRQDQLIHLANTHSVKITDKKAAQIILRKIPYNLLVYPALTVWPIRGKKAIRFMDNTTIENLEDLVQFDSFIKGKVLEIIRSFENMLLGSYAYHLELEYLKVINMSTYPKKGTVIQHNIGYSKHNELIFLEPMWDQFFSDDMDVVTIDDEISLWNTLTKQKFLAKPQNSNVYHDKLNSTRFTEYEIKFVKKNFSTSTVRRQIIDDIINFSGVSASRWKSKIGTKNFPAMMDLIRIFRNAASHPGSILEKKAHVDNRYIDNDTYFNQEFDLKKFIDLLRLIISDDIMDSFTYDIKKKLLYLHHNKNLSRKHILKIESKIGVYMFDLE